MKKLLSLGFLLAAACAGAATIVTTRAVAKVYPNPIRRVYEQPLFVLEKGEVVEVIQWGRPLTKIRNKKARRGWVDITLLDSLKRPPILNLSVDSSAPVKPLRSPAGRIGNIPALPLAVTDPATRTKDTVKTAKDAEVVVKKWAPAVDTARKPTQKPVDFRGDTSHISPPAKVDSAK